MNDIIVTGSVAEIAKAENKSIAEVFAGCSLIVVVDTSASMSEHDSRGGRSRYDVACEELAALQNENPGKVAVISFSSEVQFCPSGLPWNFGEGTDMVKALKFAKVADVAGIDFVLISDGEPDDPRGTLAIARQYKNKISTIYVGSETGSGRKFLAELAEACGGETGLAARADGLKRVINLLEAGK